MDIVCVCVPLILWNSSIHLRKIKIFFLFCRRQYFRRIFNRNTEFGAILFDLYDDDDDDDAQAFMHPAHLANVLLSPSFRETLKWVSMINHYCQMGQQSQIKDCVKDFSHQREGERDETATSFHLI